MTRASLIVLGVAAAAILSRRRRHRRFVAALRLILPLTGGVPPFVPSPGLLWLTSAAFLEPVEWPDDFGLASCIYVPFLVLIVLEIAWRLRRARRRLHAEPIGIAAR